MLEQTGFFSSEKLLVVPMHQSLPMVQSTSSVFTPYQGISLGRETGLVEVLTPGTIFGGPGQVTFKGIAPSRPIQVFGYYGDDKDPGASGVVLITPSQKESKSDLSKIMSVLELHTSLEDIPISLQHSEKLEQENSSSSLLYTKEEPSTMLVLVHLLHLEQQMLQVPSSTQTIQFYSQFLESTKTCRPQGRHGWNDFHLQYRKDCYWNHAFYCKAGTEYTFSLFSSGAESIVIPSDTIIFLFDIEGIADTREIQVYGYYGDDRDPGTSGTITIVGELTHPQIDFTPAETGFGDLTFVGESIVKVDLKIVGKGTLPLSGTATEKFVSISG